MEPGQSWWIDLGEPHYLSSHVASWIGPLARERASCQGRFRAGSEVRSALIASPSPRPKSSHAPGRTSTTKYPQVSLY